MNASAAPRSPSSSAARERKPRISARFQRSPEASLIAIAESSTRAISEKSPPTRSAYARKRSALMCSCTAPASSAAARNCRQTTSEPLASPARRMFMARFRIMWIAVLRSPSWAARASPSSRKRVASSMLPRTDSTAASRSRMAATRGPSPIDRACARRSRLVATNSSSRPAANGMLFLICLASISPETSPARCMASTARSHIRSNSVTIPVPLKFQIQAAARRAAATVDSRPADSASAAASAAASLAPR